MRPTASHFGVSELGPEWGPARLGSLFSPTTNNRLSHTKPRSPAVRIRRPECRVVPNVPAGGRSELAGPHVHRAVRPGQLRPKGMARHLGQIPVAARDRSAADPNLSDGPVGHLLQRVRVHDPDRLVRPPLRLKEAAGALEERAVALLRRPRNVSGPQPAPHLQRGGPLHRAGDVHAILGQPVRAAPRRRLEAVSAVARAKLAQRLGADRLCAYVSTTRAPLSSLTSHSCR